MSTFCSIICWQHGPGYDRRHFHQLFHQLRLANCRSQGDVLRQDHGHFDNLLLIPRAPERSGRARQAAVPPSAAQVHRESAKGRSRRSAARCAAVPVLAVWTRQTAGPAAPAGLFFKAEELRLGCGGVRIVAVQFISRPHTPALAIVCPREEWCVLSARAIATVIRSCLSHERSRRCRRRCGSSRNGLLAEIHSTTGDANKGTLGIDSLLLLNGYIIVKELLLLDGLTLAFFFRRFSSENVYLCFTSNENCHFSSEKRLPPKTGC